MRRSRPAGFLAAIAVLALVAGCGGSSSGGSQPTAPSGAAPQASAPAQKPLQKVNMRLPWIFGGYMVPFVVAKEKGYYAQAGFDASVLEGKGSATAVETVGNGSDTFGLADASTAAKLISKGAPIKVLAVFVQQSPMSFIHDPSIVIKSPHDIVGHPLITSAGDADRQVLPAVLAKAGMKESDVKFDFVDPSAYAKTLVSTPGAIMLGFMTSDFQNVLTLKPNYVADSYAKFGVNVYNVGLITSLKEIQEHPDDVKAFTAATIKGWKDTVADPKAAVQLGLKAFPHSTEFQLTDGLNRAMALMSTDNSKGHPIGWMAQADWQQTIDIMHQYGGLDPVKPLTDYYTNDFLPQP